MTLPNSTVIDHYPVKDIPRQASMSTWESIWAIHLNLKANVASVPSDLGGGANGHLGLTIG
eukprot:1907406-Ditylum_brightwellii.AAC.1